MNIVYYFTNFFVSIPDYKKIVLLMFLINNGVIFLYECGFLKVDIIYLHKDFKNILFELNEVYLDHIKNQGESIFEKILKSKWKNDNNHLSFLFTIFNK